MNSVGDQSRASIPAAKTAGLRRWVWLGLASLIFLAGGWMAGLFIQTQIQLLTVASEPEETASPTAAPSKSSSPSPSEPSLEATASSETTQAEQVRNRLKGDDARARSEEIEPDLETDGKLSGRPSSGSAPSTNSTSPTVVPGLPGSQSEADVGDGLEQADRLFRAGNFRLARDRYIPMLADSTGAIDGLLLLKLALCEEALGNRKAALAAYREILGLTPKPAIRCAAVQGQARIWAAGGESGLATAALFRNLIEEVTADDRNAMLHQLAGLVARRALPVDQQIRNSEQVYRDHILIPPELIVHPNFILDSVSTRQAQQASPHVPLRQELIVVRQTRQLPDDTVVSLQYERSSALDVLDKTLRGTGFTAKLNRETQAILSAHTLEPECLEIPLSLVLDCILEPLELVWELTESAIRITPANEINVEALTKYRREAALRILRLACTQAPDHPDAAASQLEVARISAVVEPRSVPIQALEQAISKYPRSDYLSIAWFNLGKLLLQEGRPADATIAFHRAADLLSGETLEVACNLYIGRICVENDDIRSAVGPFTRGLSLSTGTPHEATATLQLSAVYLMLNHFQRANNVLMEHLPVLEAKEIRDQAAFLSALIHYRWTSDEHERFRHGITLLSTLTNLKIEDCFGGLWWWQAGCASRDIGLTQSAIQIFCKSIENSYSFPLQNRMRALLLKDDPEQLSRLPSGKRAVAAHQAPESFQVDSVLVEAEAQFLQGQYEESLRLCRDVLRRKNANETHHLNALRLLGKVFQAQGRYEESVQCFTGIIPKDIPPAPGPSAAAQREIR